MERMTIEVYSDMVCPWCRIGKKHLGDALSEWSAEGGGPVSVTYRAFQLDPDLPAEGLPFAEAMARKMGGPEGMQRATAQVTQAGAASGVTFRFDRVERMPNTHLAHRLVALAPESGKERLIDAVFAAYFERGVDIAQLDRLIELAEAAGLDGADLRARLAAGEGAAQVDADLANARKLGVNGVPFFIVGNRYAFSGAYPSAEMVRIMKKAAEAGQPE